MLIIKNTSASGSLYAACTVVPAGPNGQWPGINGRNYPPTSIVVGPGQTWSDDKLVATHFYVYLYDQENPAGGTVQPFWHGRLRPLDGIDADPGTQATTIIPQDAAKLDNFDHVVVIMLENRSLDNLLGYLYPDGVPAGAPLGKTFDGVAGKTLSNPVPASEGSGPKDIFVSPVGADPVNPDMTYNYFQPYPDPGEYYDHVNTQLFNTTPEATYNTPPYNAPAAPTDEPFPQPAMNGFVNDYIYNFQNAEEKGTAPTLDEYSQIMQCFPTGAVPVLSQLATDFGVFDHWFCDVPSQTWCNRVFWNAGTSWGFVINPPDSTSKLKNTALWMLKSGSPTIFNQIQGAAGSGLSWKVYASSLKGTPLNSWLSLTHLIHFGALEHYWNFNKEKNHFFTLEDFKQDCANSTLPSYSFLEPQFIMPNNDMHPESFDSKIFGRTKVGSVLTGEKLVADVYEAVRSSPQRDRTLLIITFDEHGGCYDHVAPPTHIEDAAPPDLTNDTLEHDFGFTRLGVRVPTIMVSSFIAPNTVVNTPMNHGSFMKTVGQKWNKTAPGNFSPLTARVVSSLEFTEVFTSPVIREWPVVNGPIIPGADDDFPLTYGIGPVALNYIDFSSHLPQIGSLKRRMPNVLPAPTKLQNGGDAVEYMRLAHHVVKNPEVEAFRIGNIYDGGIVFYLDDTGEHGLIAQQQDLTGLFTLAEAHKAASFEDGWHVPTIDELGKLYLTKAIVGGLNGAYWSSTKGPQHGSLVKHLLGKAEDAEGIVDGNEFDHDEGLEMLVRAVKRF